MQQKSVLITGASTGIGRAVTLELDRLGYAVFAGVRREEDGRALVAACSGRVRPVPLDVTIPGERLAALRVAAGPAGDALFAVVNNAGHNLNGPFETHDEAAARALMEVNFFGATALMREAVPLLRACRATQGYRPHLVNVSSVGGLIGFPWEAFYHASKFALLGLSESVRQELDAQGINVSVVLPGGVRTPFMAKSAASIQLALSRLDEGGQARYAPALRRLQGTLALAQRWGSPPASVARRIAGILRRDRPRLRHLVGADARLLYALHRLLPLRWAHASWASAFGTR